MPNELFRRELKAVTIEVKSVQKLISLHAEGDLFKATYRETREISDDSELPAVVFSVDRSIDKIGQPLLDWIATGAQLAEQYRQEDEDQRASDKVKAEVEAIRWAKLTPEEQKAEVEAARQKFLDDQKNATPVDPTPLGPP